MSCSIPITNKLIAYYHKTTLIKARIQGIIKFLKKKRIKSLNEDVFSSYGIFYAMGYRILKLNNPRLFKNNLTRNKIKNQKKVMTIDQIRIIEEIL